MQHSWSNWNLEMLVLRREENRSTQRKTSQTKGENQQQTQPNNHCSDLDPGIIGGRQVFSPLPHPCSHNPPFTMGVNLGLISFYRSRWWVKGGRGVVALFQIVRWRFSLKQNILSPADFTLIWWPDLICWNSEEGRGVGGGGLGWGFPTWKGQGCSSSRLGV